MIKGGYQIIDLKGIELDDTPVTYDGIYDKMLENVGKVCLVANIDVDNDPNFDHYFVQPIISGTTILCTVGNKTLKVNAEDGVSVEDGIVGGGPGGSSDYTDLSNKPSINSITLAGNKTAHDLGLQGELTAGSGINIENDVISSTGSSGPKITLSGTIASSSSYSGFNDLKQKAGSITATNHNVVMNCPVDLKPLITTSSYAENMLTVPVEGVIYPGTSYFNSCYLQGMAYIYETSTKYYIYIRCTSARGQRVVQSILSDYSVNKSSMSDPTKLILTDTKLPTISYTTAAEDLGLGIETYVFTQPIQINNGYGSGQLFGIDIYNLFSVITMSEKAFIKGIEIDNTVLDGSISAIGCGTYEWDEELQRDLYKLTIYFLSFVMSIIWDEDLEEYKYSVSRY